MQVVSTYPSASAMMRSTVGHVSEQLGSHNFKMARSYQTMSDSMLLLYAASDNRRVQLRRIEDTSQSEYNDRQKSVYRRRSSLDDDYTSCNAVVSNGKATTGVSCLPIWIPPA